MKFIKTAKGGYLNPTKVRHFNLFLIDDKGKTLRQTVRADEIVLKVFSFERPDDSLIDWSVKDKVALDDWSKKHPYYSENQRRDLTAEQWNEQKALQAQWEAELETRKAKAREEAQAYLDKLIEEMEGK